MKKGPLAFWERVVLLSRDKWPCCNVLLGQSLGCQSRGKTTSKTDVLSLVLSPNSAFASFRLVSEMERSIGHHTIIQIRVGTAERETLTVDSWAIRYSNAYD